MAQKTRYRELNEQEQQLAILIGKKVQELRENKEISQTQLGKQAGLNQTTLSLIETGKQLPSLGSLIKLGQVFDKELTILFAEKPWNTQNKEELYHESNEKESSGKDTD